MPEGEVPDNANEHCPGVGSENAGKADACQGCPNQSICSTAPKGPDPDIPIIQERMKDIKHKILVLSGKGGVGKSTFSSQLAFALAIDPDVEVGLVDVDVCGPSGAVMCGVEDQAMSHTRADGLISPIYTSQNISLVSVACLLQENDTPLIWRGNKKNQLIKQFLRDIDWGELDFLIVDTPPGTSDEHLSIVDYLKPAHIDGAIVITTPQEVSLADVRKEINFCKKVNIPILGIVENMSGFVCPNCQGESLIFPPTTGGAKKLSADLKIPLLGSIPLDPRIGKCSDEGKSFLETHPGTHAAKSYQQIIENLLAQLLNK